MRTRMLAVAGLATAATLGLGGPAAAQQNGDDVDYSAVQGVSVSNPNPPANQPFTITGTGCPSGTVDIFLDDTVVADDVPVNSDGTFTATVMAPDRAGTYTYSSVCGTTTVRVLDTAPQQEALPRTGDDTSVSLARIGVVAIAGGGVLLALSRRRRPVTV